MTTAMVLPTMLFVANVTGVGMIVPQVRRLARLRTTEGVSGVWAGVGVALNLWWFVYALQGQIWGILPVSIGGTAVYVMLAGLYGRIDRRAAIRPLALGALLGVGPLPFLLIGGWHAAGLAIGLSYGLQFSPAVIAAVTSRTAEGVSSMTWTMAWIEAVIWLVYGLIIGDPALIVGGAGGTLMSSIILGRLAFIAEPTPIHRLETAV